MEETKATENSSLLVPGAILLAGVLIAGAVVYSNSATRTPGSKNAAAIGQGANPLAGGEPGIGDLADDDPFLGSPDAPVTLVEFSDFQCPFCRKLFRETLPQIEEKYIKTGKIRFVYRDFPLTSIHEMAQKYAEAGECADDQGKFWKMHDKIFEEQEKVGASTIYDYTVADVKRWAREIGLDGSQFDQCLDSDKYFEEVQKDFRDGELAGVQGTPGTFVNGRLIPGAVPFVKFEAVIEEELKKAGY